MRGVPLPPHGGREGGGGVGGGGKPVISDQKSVIRKSTSLSDYRSLITDHWLPPPGSLRSPPPPPRASRVGGGMEPAAPLRTTCTTCTDGEREDTVNALRFFQAPQAALQAAAGRMRCA